MYPEDRVLVAIMTSTSDLDAARDEGWYRIPEERAPKGVHAEYLAFYFNRAFGEKKWAIHYYCRQLGHELVQRRDLIPEEWEHPKAGRFYYKIQLGPLIELERPIVSLRWRRISFIHTTWDRFIDASEINDLLIEGDPYVDRLYYALREEGLYPERDYLVREDGAEYKVDLAIPCRLGIVSVVVGEHQGPCSSVILTTEQIKQDTAGCAHSIKERVDWFGGSTLLTTERKQPRP